jgi:hypothetical protein
MVLKMRASAASVAQLLSLVPRLAGLDLHIVHDTAARSKNVLRVIARQLACLRRLTARFPGDFAVDYGGLQALARRALTVLELRVCPH